MIDEGFLDNEIKAALEAERKAMDQLAFVRGNLNVLRQLRKKLETGAETPTSPINDEHVLNPGSI